MPCRPVHSHRLRSAGVERAGNTVSDPVENDIPVGTSIHIVPAGVHARRHRGTGLPINAEGDVGVSDRALHDAHASDHHLDLGAAALREAVQGCRTRLYAGEDALRLGDGEIQRFPPARVNDPRYLGSSKKETLQLPLSDTPCGSVLSPEQAISPIVSTTMNRLMSASNASNRKTNGHRQRRSSGDFGR